MARIGAGLAILTLAVITVAPVSAETATVGALHDATIYGVNVNNSNGAGVGLFAGGNSNMSTSRGLVSFDIPSANIPTGATITDVAMTLTLGQSAGSGGQPGQGDSVPRNFSIFRVTSPWGEGTTGAHTTTIGGTGQGFSANPGDATWSSNFHTISTWATPGGDRVATASAVLAVDNQFQHGYVWGSTAQMVADVQGWLNDPSSNFGWLLVNTDESGFQTFRAFYQKEWNIASMRPQLAITYLAPVPVPAAVWLFGSGLAGLLGIGRRKAAQSTTIYIEGFWLSRHFGSVTKIISIKP